MVAKQVSNTATSPGTDAPRPGVLFYRQHAETHPTSRPTLSARRSECSWVGNQLICGGIAAACTLAASFRERSSNRSPNDPNVARGSGHEIVIWIRRALGCRCPVSCVAVQPHRCGNVANRTKLHASRRRGSGAEPGGEAASQAGGKHWCRSPRGAAHPDARSNSHSDGTACAGFGDGEACPARENQQQLHRRLQLEFQVRQPTLEWLLRVGG